MHPSGWPLDHPTQETSPPWCSQIVPGAQVSICQCLWLVGCWAAGLGAELAPLPEGGTVDCSVMCRRSHNWREERLIIRLKFPFPHRCETVMWGSAKSFNIFTSPAKCTEEDSLKYTFLMVAVHLFLSLTFSASSPTQSKSYLQGRFCCCWLFAWFDCLKKWRKKSVSYKMHLLFPFVCILESGLALGPHPKPPTKSMSYFYMLVHVQFYLFWNDAQNQAVFT